MAKDNQLGNKALRVDEDLTLLRSWLLGRIWPGRYPSLEQWDPPVYKKLAAQYEYHVDIVSDLMLELTRTANLVCDEHRSSFSVTGGGT